MIAKQREKSQGIVKRGSDLADSVTALDYIKQYSSSRFFVMTKTCFKNSSLTFKGSDSDDQS